MAGASRPYRSATPDLRDVNAALARSRVLVVGLEPWGAVAAADLAIAGLGAIHLLDDGQVSVGDIFAVSSLSDADRGKDRRAGVAEALSRLAPACSVTTGAPVVAPGQPLSLEDSRWDLVLSCVPGDDLLILQSVARFSHAAGVISLSAHLEGLDAVIGPTVVPGETACWNCVRLRRLASRDDGEIEDALDASLLSERARSRLRTYLGPMPAALGHALSLSAIDVLTKGAAASSVGRVMVQNLVSLETSFHTALRMHMCEVCGGAREAFPEGVSPAGSGVRLDEARTPAELRRVFAGIVDARVGIIKSLTVGAADPDVAIDMPWMALATLSAYSRCAIHDHRSEPETGSGKGLSRVEAMIGAVGEAVERYAAERFDPAHIVRAAASELDGDFIAPERLCLYSEEQYREPGFPYARPKPEAPIDWTRGVWLDTGGSVYAPALPVHYNYPTPPEEYFCQVTSNGLAAGPTFEDAAMRATLELIERDAFMISWLARRSGRRVVIDESVDPGAREIVRQLAAQGARIELHLLDVGVGVPTVMCIGFGDGVRWPGATVSIAAHMSPRVAIKKAILEQGQAGPYLRRMMEEGKEAIPERPDDVRTLEDHALYYIPQDRAVAFDFLRGAASISAAELEEPRDISLGALAGRLRAAGLRVAVVHLTSPDLAASPFRVARAIGLDMQQIHFGHRLARLGNPRLWGMAPRGINPDPHPMD